MDDKPCSVSITAPLLLSVWFNRCSPQSGKTNETIEEKPHALSIFPPKEGFLLESKLQEWAEVWDSSTWVRNKETCLPPSCLLSSFHSPTSLPQFFPWARKFGGPSGNLIPHRLLENPWARTYKEAVFSLTFEWVAVSPLSLMLRV